MLALTGRHAKAASSLQDLDSFFPECGVFSISRYTPNHQSGGATRQSHLGGLSPLVLPTSTSHSPSSGGSQAYGSDPFILGPEWDLPILQDDDDLSWVRDDAARQAYYDKICQEEFDKLMLEWQQEKEARVLSSTPLPSISPPICEASVDKKFSLEPAEPLSVLEPAEPLDVMEPAEILAVLEPAQPLAVLEPAELLTVLEPAETLADFEQVEPPAVLEPSGLSLEPSVLSLEPSELPLEPSKVALDLSELPLDSSEVLLELSELPLLRSRSFPQCSWSLLVGRVRPPPAPPWSL
jgi:hypothetical protein